MADDVVAGRLLRSLIDSLAILEDYVLGGKRNWDGSTLSQARSVIREGNQVIELARRSGVVLEYEAEEK